MYKEYKDGNRKVYIGVARSSSMEDLKGLPAQTNEFENKNMCQECENNRKT